MYVQCEEEKTHNRQTENVCRKYAPVAQLVEQQPFKLFVGSSILLRGTICWVVDSQQTFLPPFFRMGRWRISPPLHLSNKK